MQGNYYIPTVHSTTAGRSIHPVGEEQSSHSAHVPTHAYVPAPGLSAQTLAYQTMNPYLMGHGDTGENVFYMEDVHFFTHGSDGNAPFPVDQNYLLDPIVGNHSNSNSSLLDAHSSFLSAPNAPHSNTKALIGSRPNNISSVESTGAETFHRDSAQVGANSLTHNEFHSNHDMPPRVNEAVSSHSRSNSMSSVELTDAERSHSDSAQGGADLHNQDMNSLLQSREQLIADMAAEVDLPPEWTNEVLARAQFERINPDDFTEDETEKQNRLYPNRTREEMDYSTYVRITDPTSMVAAEIVNDAVFYAMTEDLEDLNNDIANLKNKTATDFLAQIAPRQPIPTPGSIANGANFFKIDRTALEATLQKMGVTPIASDLHAACLLSDLLGEPVAPALLEKLRAEADAAMSPLLVQMLTAMNATGSESRHELEHALKSYYRLNPHVVRYNTLEGVKKFAKLVRTNGTDRLLIGNGRNPATDIVLRRETSPQHQSHARETSVPYTGWWKSTPDGWQQLKGKGNLRTFLIDLWTDTRRPIPMQMLSLFNGMNAIPGLLAERVLAFHAANLNSSTLTGSVPHLSNESILESLGASLERAGHITPPVIKTCRRFGVSEYAFRVVNFDELHRQGKLVKAMRNHITAGVNPETRENRQDRLKHLATLMTTGGVAQIRENETEVGTEMEVRRFTDRFKDELRKSTPDIRGIRHVSDLEKQVSAKPGKTLDGLSSEELKTEMENYLDAKFMKNGSPERTSPAKLKSDSYVRAERIMHKVFHFHMSGSWPYRYRRVLNNAPLNDFPS